MFRIGQRVVWIGDESHTVSTVLDIQPAWCKCGGFDLWTDDPTISDHKDGGSSCPDCKEVRRVPIRKWRSSDCFRPLDEDYAEGVLSKIKDGIDENLELLEQIKTKENV